MSSHCETEKGLLTLNQALKSILTEIVSINTYEQCSLKKALNRVLVQSVVSPINIPPERNAAMDGYAFSSTHITSHQAFTLRHIGTSWAGKPFTGDLKYGECVRIFTGAVIPHPADTVIMQERVTVKKNQINFPPNWVAFDNVRPAGGDAQQGAELLSAPRKLKSVDLGLLAAAGIHSVEVTRKLRVAYLSTGDELIPIGQALQSGQIYDSNRYLLHGLLDDTCINAIDIGVIADDKSLLEQVLTITAKNYDVIITTGGASVGDADYIQEILAKIGRVNFWKIAMKPGKPMAFGHIGRCVFFGLPGNPVSVTVTFQQLVQPALRQLMGLKVIPSLRLQATCQQPLKKIPGRQEFQRGILIQHTEGHFLVTSAGGQASNQLSSLSRANCYIVLLASQTYIQAGEKVWVEPFDGFIGSFF